VYSGDIRLGETIDIKFTTRKFSTGAPFTLAGSPAVSAYVGNGTTEITSGITLSVDFDSVTGLNNVRVVASGGNGFATATNVSLVITAGTVDSVSVVGEVVGAFSIENRSAVMPTTAARTLDVSAGGEAGVDWANIGSPTTTVNLSGTSTLALEPTTAGRKLDVTTTGEAGIDWANIGAPTTTQNLSGTSISTVATATAVTTVNGLAANVITATALATSAVDEISDGVWDEQLSGHTTAGSAGKALSDAGSAGDPWSTALPGAYGAGTAGHIVGTGIPDIAPGAANGLFKAGSNAATSITTALTANVIGNITGNLSGSVGSVATGGIAAASFAAGAIDAAAIATDAIGANEISAAAVTKIQTGLATPTNITAGTITTVTNLTNAPTAGDLTATMKTSVTTAASAATPALSAAGVDAIWDDAVDGSVTARQSLRLANSANGAIVAGAATPTVTIRDLADTKDRVTATVDASGNRTAVSRDLT